VEPAVPSFEQEPPYAIALRQRAVKIDFHIEVGTKRLFVWFA
jgi:hypothetical protein